MDSTKVSYIFQICNDLFWLNSDLYVKIDLKSLGGSEVPKGPQTFCKKSSFSRPIWSCMTHHLREIMFLQVHKGDIALVIELS